MKKNTFLYWILAIVITLAAVVFQRITGPTNPTRVNFTIDDVVYSTKLPRSVTIGSDFSAVNFTIKNLPADITVEMVSRAYSKDYVDTFLPNAVKRDADNFSVWILSQAPTKKVEYIVLFVKDKEVVAKIDPVVARFKRDVPAALLIPHILLMFMAMLLSNLAGLLAAFRRDGYQKYSKIMWICLFLGGIVIGCLVQKAAFGVYWTGFPLGSDLTDNKTLFALLIWSAAIAGNWRSSRKPWWAVIAAVFMLLIYCIPHSM